MKTIARKRDEALGRNFLKPLLPEPESTKAPPQPATTVSEPKKRNFLKRKRKKNAAPPSKQQAKQTKPYDLVSVSPASYTVTLRSKSRRKSLLRFRSESPGRPTKRRKTESGNVVSRLRSRILLLEQELARAQKRPAKKNPRRKPSKKRMIAVPRPPSTPPPDAGSKPESKPVQKPQYTIVRSRRPEQGPSPKRAKNYDKPLPTGDWSVQFTWDERHYVSTCALQFDERRDSKSCDIVGRGHGKFGEYTIKGMLMRQSGKVTLEKQHDNGTAKYSGHIMEDGTLAGKWSSGEARGMFMLAFSGASKPARAQSTRKRHWSVEIPLRNRWSMKVVPAVTNSSLEEE